MASSVPMMLRKLLLGTRYGKAKPLYLGDLKTVVCGDNYNQVHIYFGGQVAWLALSKQDAVRFCKTILKQAGANDVTVRF